MNEILDELDFLAKSLAGGKDIAVLMFGEKDINSILLQCYFEKMASRMKAVRDKVEEHCVLYGDPSAPKPQGIISHG